MKFNKTMMIATLAVGSLFASGLPSQAQDNTNTPPSGGPPGAPGMRARPNPEQIAKELGLNDDQKAKLKTLLTDQQTKMRSLRDDTSLSQEDKRAKAKEIRDATQTQLKEILTPEQFAKWQEHMKRNRPPGGAGSGSNGNAKPNTSPQQ
jgi:Spy/CpxP family protein refolding chaperone